MAPMNDTLLPPKSTPLQRALETTLHQEVAVDVPIKTLWNPDTCPEPLLPWLAWSLSVDRWDTNWSATQKRGVIKAAVELHKKNGTPSAVKRSIEALGFSAKLIEWFNSPELAPHSFRVEFEFDGNSDGVSQSLYTELVNVVVAAKSRRSNLESFGFTARSSATQTIAAATVAGTSTDIFPWSVMGPLIFSNHLHQIVEHDLYHALENLS
ncbi:phage tail protein I [gamma proteobacterium HTCC5015]|nr:phage tail protein I [gamma proteobacterium HTCC5015]